MTLSLRGANLAGGDNYYAEWDNPNIGPVSGTDYQFVGKADVDRLVGKGMNFFRLLFGWESMQPASMRAIPGPGNYGTYFRNFAALVDYITRVKRCWVMIDIHGGDDRTFARYYGKVVGSQVPTSVFTNLWTQLATTFKTNPYVCFGITNEPMKMPTMQWFGVAQATIDAIRKTGAQGYIFMPGNYFTGAGSWTSTSTSYDTGIPKRTNGYGWDNANGPGKPLHDPLGRLGVQVHMYFDADGGGNDESVASPTIGVERLKVITDWARARKLWVLVAEIGLSASSPLALAAWHNVMAYAEANKNVILGFAWWAYGVPAWWGSYRFALVDEHGQETPQMKLIEGNLR